MNKKAKEVMDAIALKRNASLSRHFYLIYWHMHDSRRKKWTEDGWSEITTDHIKLISVISGEERMMSNNELAKRVGVTKQAMSQMVALLEKRGVLTVQADPNDSRAKLISLSDYGVEFLVYFSSSMVDLEKNYIKIIGKEKMKTLTDIAGELANGLFAIEGKDYFLNIKK